MVKHFKIIMAAVISGIVALFTTYLGVSGTVIGSVLSSFLYQLLSGYFEEKTENMSFSDFSDSNILSSSNNHNNSNNSNPGDFTNSAIRNSNSNNAMLNNRNNYFASKVAFVFPIIVVILVEFLFCLTDFNYNFVKLFNILELATAQNLFRVMGIAIILLSIYPFFKSAHIKKINGTLLFISGILLLLRGLIDFHPLLLKIYYNFLAPFDSLLAGIIILLLLCVVINVLREGVKDLGNKNLRNAVNQNYNARKIETGPINNNRINNDGFNNSNQNRQIYNHQADGTRRVNNLNNSKNYGHYVENEDPNRNYSQNYPNNYSGYDDIPPIYEEDYIYVSDPNNPNKPIKKKILKKVNNPYNKFRNRR